MVVMVIVSHPILGIPIGDAIFMDIKKYGLVIILPI